MLEQHLLTDADAEKRLVRCRVDHRLFQAALGQFTHAVGHGALTGHHHAFSRRQYCRVGRDHHLFAASHMLQRLGHRTQITHAVVDYGDGASGH